MSNVIKLVPKLRSDTDFFMEPAKVIVLLPEPRFTSQETLLSERHNQLMTEEMMDMWQRIQNIDILE